MTEKTSTPDELGAASGPAALPWTVETPTAGGWWWLELGGGRYEAVLVWPPNKLQELDPDEEWEDGAWYFESVAWAGWMVLAVTRGLRWAGGPATSRAVLGEQPPPNVPAQAPLPTNKL